MSNKPLPDFVVEKYPHRKSSRVGSGFLGETTARQESINNPMHTLLLTFIAKSSYSPGMSFRTLEQAKQELLQYDLSKFIVRVY